MILIPWLNEVRIIRDGSCQCRDGYEEIDGVCQDINECGLGTKLCILPWTCKNTVGNYTCQENVLIIWDSVSTCNFQAGNRNIKFYFTISGQELKFFCFDLIDSKSFKFDEALPKVEWTLMSDDSSSDANLLKIKYLSVNFFSEFRFSNAAIETISSGYLVC